MLFRNLVRLGFLGCAVWLTTGVAAAKMIDMGAQSRSSVKAACDRAGGHPFGIFDTSGVFGCRHTRATIVCGPDLSCAAAVSDLLPMTGNSLDTILGLARSHPAAVAVQPVNARVYPVNP